MPISDNDIESELSYAYLHAVAAAAGCECSSSPRISDNHKIDATVRCFDDFGPGTLSNVTLLVQLKATIQKLHETQRAIAFDLDLATYESLSSTPSESAQILVLLRLPGDKSRWLTGSTSALSLRRCAYWVSLVGAPASPNKTTQRVYFPKKNRLTPTALRTIIEISARGGRISYAGA